MVKLNEFYQQLGLLVKSKLPLPEALNQLEKTLRSPLYSKIEADLASGLSLHEALSKYPGAFPDKHLKLIKMAEEKNTLSETLVELAKYSHFEKIIQSKIRDILFYPMIILGVGFVILGIVGKVFIYPLVHQFFNIFYEGSELPFFYKIARVIGIITHDYSKVYWISVLIVFIFLCFIVFNVLRIKVIDETWMKICSLWTDMRGIFESSRLCSFLSLQFKNNVSLHESCESATQFVSKGLGQELSQCSRALEQGVSSKEIFQQTIYLDPLIISTLENCSETEIGTEMSKLADHYFERVYLTSERLVTYWKIISTIMTAILVFLLMQVMMAPIIYLIRLM